MANDDFLMAWLSGAMTGLRHSVYLSPELFRNLPRIKISNVPGKAGSLRDSFTILLEPDGSCRFHGKVRLPGEDLAATLRWIDRNRETIQRYGHGEIGTGEMVHALR